jgi:hypothetical protein
LDFLGQKGNKVKKFTDRNLNYWRCFFKWELFLNMQRGRLFSASVALRLTSRSAGN